MVLIKDKKIIVTPKEDKIISTTLQKIEKKIRSRLLDELHRANLLFRLFSRVKNKAAIEEKFERKNYIKQINSGGKSMQDLIGFRITTYFHDDLKIVIEICKKIFKQIEFVYDEPNPDEFRPVRKNMVCELPSEENDLYNELKEAFPAFKMIDNTFEIQFRTTLSEGWHEVEHLMRYKCAPEWKELPNESRILNGIYASLETNDSILRSLFDEIAYQHYKSKNWEAMIRNKFRLRFTSKKLDPVIINYLNNNNDIGKRIYKSNRVSAITTYLHSEMHFDATFNNWVYFINYLIIRDNFLLEQTPKALINEFEKFFTKKTV